MDCIFNTQVFIFFRFVHSIIFLINNNCIRVAQIDLTLISKDNTFNVFSIEPTFDVAVEGDRHARMLGKSLSFLEIFLAHIKQHYLSEVMNNKLFSMFNFGFCNPLFEFIKAFIYCATGVKRENVSQATLQYLNLLIQAIYFLFLL